MLRFLKSALGPGLVAAAALLAPAHAGAEQPPAATDVHAATAAPAHADAAHAADAGAHGEAKPNPMKAEPGLAVWTLVVFACLLAVLGKYAWKPLVEALHNREHHLEQTLLQTEKARDDAASLLAEHRRLMAEADDRARDLIYQAQRKAETRAAELIRQAQDEAESARDRAQREIASARDQALAEIWTRTADVAVSVAANVLAREIGEDERRRLTNDAIGSLPEAGGARS
ncbi:F0F1 ATP synthase subunit B [Paludisphaera sp.]|uniref:F0F1 ATP synthase subunit B n=1 Tax=Paludisphaera sp. TaxID=2017432 RepID=UPI00301CB37E